MSSDDYAWFEAAVTEHLRGDDRDFEIATRGLARLRGDQHRRISELEVSFETDVVEELPIHARVTVP